MWFVNVPPHPRLYPFDQVKPEARKMLTELLSAHEVVGSDSLDITELIMEFEEESGCQIPAEDAEQIRSVADLSDYILRKVQEGE